MVHPLAVLLDEAAHGHFPPPDGAVRVLPPLPGGLDALVSFTGTFALAGELSQAEVDERVPRGDFSLPMSAAVVQWLAERLSARPATQDAVLVAISPGSDASGPVEMAEQASVQPGTAVKHSAATSEHATIEMEQASVQPGTAVKHSAATSEHATIDIAPVDLSDHPRVQRALRYRRDVRAYATADRSGVVVLGRGITGRWEIAFEVDDEARGAGRGRALAAAGVALLPAGTPVWAQVAPGNAASLRVVLAAGFQPVGAEILFVRDSQ